MIAVNITGNRIDETPLLGQLVQGQAYLETVVFLLPEQLGDISPNSLSYTLRLKSIADTIAAAVLDKEQNGESLQLIWGVSQDFTAVPGPTKIEIWGTDPENRVQYRAVSGTFNIIPNLGTGENLPPKSEIETMVEQSRENALQAIAAAEKAGQSEAQAQKYAKDAEESANRAEQTAAQNGYVKFYIDENGHLIYIRTDNVEGIDFSLKEGRLMLQSETKTEQKDR